ncbi:hypothetical protein SUGI_0311870 [Cryptomeria japonica]|uniref:ferredoxin C 1, chloroplastic n=1 Tax=Cryptomeria japonica TaxID=3369 RepID=UPI002408DFA7|nr:ferredoxin C 1, chloroplastic [Cryptomeria japonica]GLJ17832.1 hypothetical protein SUGI_0311870 [Cryptomeria japonica]
MARSLISSSIVPFKLPFRQTSALKGRFSIQAQFSFDRLYTEYLSQRNINVLCSNSSKTGRKSSGAFLCRAGKIYSVEIEHEGKKHILQVEEDETILSKALDAGIDVPHDCKLGVCMTCPARLLNGEVEQSEGMLSDDVVEKGYALMCSSYPRSDCLIRTIPEDELLSLQLATAND